MRVPWRDPAQACFYKGDMSWKARIYLLWRRYRYCAISSLMRGIACFAALMPSSIKSFF